MKSLRLGVAALATALFGLAGTAQAADPILIGVTSAESPPGSVVQGQQVKDGTAIMAKLINDAGGVLGRPLQLIYEDDQGIPEKGRAAVEKLITTDKVVAVTGAHQSSVVLAEIEVAHRYKIPYVNTNGWADDIRIKGYPEVFNPSNYNSRAATAMAETIEALGVKSVTIFAENTDWGIGQAKILGEILADSAPDVKYESHILDRASKDYTPAVLPLRANPPELVGVVMLAPAGYIITRQLYEQGVAPTSKTWLYDGGSITDQPDFWQNVKEAGKHVFSFGLYHPKMPVTDLGEKVAKIYKEDYGHDPNRMLFQAADSILLIARAIEESGSTDGEAIIKAMQSMEFEGTRGKFSFSQEPGFTFQQWVDIPYATYQFTEVDQGLDDSILVGAPGMPFAADKLVKPDN